MNNIKDYIALIDKVIENGQFKDNWQSLSKIKVPDWYIKSKFGLFIHWGAYSVPAFENEWYPRHMYIKDSKANKHCVKNYGENCDYRQIVAMFKPDKFDAKEWVSIFKESGARYIMPVSEHHDGVKMYDSKLNAWNTKALLGKDFCKELHDECDKQGIGYLCSSHRAEHFFFLNGARKFFPNSEVTKNLYPELYGPAFLPKNGNFKSFNDINPDGSSDYPVPKEWLEDWLASSCEMIDCNKPLAVYFDWWIYKPEFKPYIKKFLAYYYNRALEWGKEVGVFYKNCSVMQGAGIFDVERGQIAAVSPTPWQCDTAISKTSWGYTENNQFKTPREIAENLIDVVSKNGCFMLNVGPKADGTICEEEKIVLKRLGEWLKVNGEAIYDSKTFEVYGEGKVQKSGSFKENLKYKKGDYRFTFKTGAVYVFLMENKFRNDIKIKSLNFTNNGFRYNINKMEILGFDNKISYQRTKESLNVHIDGKIDTDMPLCIKLSVD